MWGFQQQFCYGLEREAGKIFAELTDCLKPSVFLVGVLREYSENHYPICIEPEEYGIGVDAFSEINKLAEEIHEKHPRKNVIHSNAYVQDQHDKRIKIESRQMAIKQVVDEHFSNLGKISFVSFPVVVDKYDVFIVMQFERSNYETFYSLKRDCFILSGTKRQIAYRSLIEALIYELMGEARISLNMPEPGSGIEVLHTAHREILRKAGARFAGNVIPPTYPFRFVYDLFDICEFVSSLKYEGSSSIGKLLIAQEDHPNINIRIKLANPASVLDYRVVRKLLEISSPEIHLLTNGHSIFGLAELTGDYDSSREDLFIVNFLDERKWEFVHDNNTMMVVEYSKPGLPKEKINRDKFLNTHKRIFPSISADAIEKLWNIVNTATEQKHGTLIIVSDKAAEEAQRLKQQSTLIKPIVPDESLIRLLTSIDGALLLDTCGKCHAIGVILDGMASCHGTPARGARYNSAVRYVDMPDNNAVAIIISEDGMVDLYPRLMPQIKRSEIENRLSTLRERASQNDYDDDVYRPIIVWFDKHRFYLSQEMCEELNKLKEEFESNVKFEEGSVRIIFNDFAPHPDMDDSYFLPE